MKQGQCGFLYFYLPAADQPSEGGTFPPEVEAALRESVAPGGVSSKRALCRDPEGKWITSTNAWGVLGRRSEQEGLDLLLNPEKQTWRPWRMFRDGDVERGTLWVGYWTDRRPGPADLVRDIIWPTVETARMGDGNDWLLPVLRKCAGQWLGPVQYVYSDDGEWIKEMEPQYAPLAKRGERLLQTWLCVPDDVWETLDSDDRVLHLKLSAIDDPMTRIEAAELICDALSLNYCISGPEASLLGLLTSSVLEVAVTNLLGVQTMEKFLKGESKKKPAAAGAAGTGSSGGGA